MTVNFNPNTTVASVGLQNTPPVVELSALRVNPQKSQITQPPPGKSLKQPKNTLSDAEPKQAAVARNPSAATRATWATRGGEQIASRLVGASQRTAFSSSVSIEFEKRSTPSLPSLSSKPSGPASTLHTFGQKPNVTQAMIGAGHTEQSLRAVDKSKIDLFVMDDFSNKNVTIGRYGSTSIKASHGEVALRIASFNLKDKLPIGHLDIGVPGKKFTTDQAAADKINSVIDMLAKRQGKTRNSPDLDLSSVTINWSRGQAYDPNAWPDDQLMAAVKALTSRGGSLIVTAGNDWYNRNAAYFPGVTVVDGSVEAIGSKVSQNPAPWAGYDNNGTGPYCQDTSVCSGVEARGSRPTNNATASLIAPSTAVFKTDADGNVKLRTVNAVTGKVEFVKFLDSSQTTKVIGKPSTTDGMSGAAPSRLVTAEEARQFSLWVDKATREVRISGANPSGRPTEGQSMTAEQQQRLDRLIKAESLKRFGHVAVMSLDALKEYTNVAPGSRTAVDLDGIVPEGMKSKDVLLSVNQVMSGRRPLGSAQVFNLDKQGKLNAMVLTTIASYGTSWGAPIAAGDIALAKASGSARPY